MTILISARSGSVRKRLCASIYTARFSRLFFFGSVEDVSPVSERIAGRHANVVGRVDVS